MNQKQKDVINVIKTLNIDNYWKEKAIESLQTGDSSKVIEFSRKVKSCPNLYENNYQLKPNYSQLLDIIKQNEKLFQ